MDDRYFMNGNGPSMDVYSPEVMSDVNQLLRRNYERKYGIRNSLMIYHLYLFYFEVRR